MLLLAQQVKLGPVLLLIGAVLVVVVIGGVVLMAVRGRVLEQPGSGAVEQGRLLDDLRSALERGEITQSEFDSAKTAMAARLAGKPPPPRPAPPPGAVRRPDGSLVAKPGVDLTGRPLPGHGNTPPGTGL
jgi:hypothetical protein